MNFFTQKGVPKRAVLGHEKISLLLFPALNDCGSPTRTIDNEIVPN